MNTKGLEPGTLITIDDQRFWVVKVVSPTVLEVLPEPELDRKRNDYSWLWEVFWVVLCLIFIFKMAL